MEDQFRVQTRTEHGATVIAVEGELDLATSPALEEALSDASRADSTSLILDLSGLEFMDSTGLSVLVRAHQRAAEEGRRFGIAGGSMQVRRLLSLTGVDERLTIAERPEDLFET